MADSLNFSELIDLESQLYRDRDLAPDLLAKRDRETGLRIEAEKLSRQQAFRRWLAGFSTGASEMHGDFVERIFRWLKIMFTISGFAAGISTASAVLSFDGAYPVNIVHFLVVFVFVQLFFLLPLICNFLPAAFKRFIPGRDEFLKLVRELGFFAGNIFARHPPRFSSEKSRSLRQIFARLRLRRGLYRSLERWLVIGLTQRFSVAFNIGALLTCLYLVLFSDLAFAWNTTLQIESKTFHTTIRTLAAPWEAFVPDAAPTEELVTKTRYFRIEGGYQSAEAIKDPQTVGAWWSFLVMSLGFYGLLPRLFMLMIVHFRYKYLLRRMPLDSAELDALYDRLTTPIVETAPLKKEIAPNNRPKNPVRRKPKTRDKFCDVVVWGEMNIESGQIDFLLGNRFGMKALSLREAGGFDALIDEKAAAGIATKSEARKNAPVVILAESWEAPSKAILYFIKLLRQKLSDKRPLILTLVNPANGGFLQPPDDMDWRIWQDALAELEDPYLRIEAGVEAV